METARGFANLRRQWKSNSNAIITVLGILYFQNFSNVLNSFPVQVFGLWNFAFNDIFSTHSANVL
jgi:hypothetical protein